MTPSVVRRNGHLRTLLARSLAALFLSAAVVGQNAASAAFTRLEPIPPPRIIASSEPYPGGSYRPGNLLDANPQTEYSSNAKGTNTFLEFDLGRPTRIAAFKHIDRNDPATIAESELVFMDAEGKPTETARVTHANKRAGVTVFVLPHPVVAQRIRWRVSALGSNYGTVGGAELAFLAAGPTEPTPKGISLEARPLRMLERDGNTTNQPLKIAIDYPYAESLEATLIVEGVVPRPVHLSPGNQTVDVSVPAVTQEKPLRITLASNSQEFASCRLDLKPVRPLLVFLLPHSHVDIGYTALQADVQRKQDSNIDTGMRLAQATADYPEGSRFKWNVEVLWPVDNYLHDETPEKRTAFIEAVRSGQVGLDAFYCNILTGLCRPEELLNLMSYATRLSDLCGVPIESAMISDVPGYTWSTVSAMAQAGVKYFSFAPNYFDRMGGTMKEWQNRPFWWKSADGHHRVLCWCPSRGYALGHIIGDGEALARFMPSYLLELETNSYPYDITHLRWNVHGDNGSPDEKIADVVRDWNAKHVSPRLIISTTAEAFRAFEQRYGDQLPEFSGDYTPYWEDGAASSAEETALNRASAERLVQAETLWAMRRPGPFPAKEFQETWRNILLYSEHTWGAHNSISQPDLPFVRDQWKVKQGFALEADRLSRQLLAQSLQPGQPPKPDAIDVFNTSSWPRTDLVTLPSAISRAGDRVLDEEGNSVPSQRLSSGELVFLARSVPAFGAKRFSIRKGQTNARGQARATKFELASPEYTVRVDGETGDIISIYSRSLKKELVDGEAATRFNQFFYLPGSDLKGLERSGPAKVSIKENGPLVASLLVESDAPGCRKLIREIRLVAGLDRVELINTVDKLPVRSKEGLHFGFPFDVRNGVTRMDVGWAAITPEKDQIPASCKNWFSVQRWLDISNDRFGVTWSPIDAPLVEFGGITANLVGSQTDHRVWIQHLEPSQTIYSWVMNNHWHTNYRADQEGPTVFRYALYAHGAFASDAAARFGVNCSQPLVAAPAAGSPSARPRLKLSSDKVLVTAFKPSDDGQATILRLFGASGKPQRITLSWGNPKPARLFLSDLSEKPATAAGETVEVPAWGIVTLRLE